MLRWCETKGLLGSRRITLFDPTADGWAFGFNPLAVDASSGDELSTSVDALVRATAQVWGGEDSSKTPLLKRCLRSLFHALAEKRLTLFEALDLVTHDDTGGLRMLITRTLEDPVIARQWEEFNSMRGSEYRETFSSTSNRLMEFLASNIVRTTIGQREHVLDLAAAMENGDIVLVNLSGGGKISDDNARLLGTMLVNDLFVKARRREKGSRPFYLYIDECSLFVNNDIAGILDQTRKFGLHLILAHQHLAQLSSVSDVVYSSVMTNAQTKVVFGGLSADDARVLAENLFIGEFDPKRVKQYRPAVTHYIRQWFRSQSTSSSDASIKSHGGAHSSGAPTSTTEGVSGEILYVSAGDSRTDSESWGATESATYAESFGESEGLEPVIEWLPEFYNLEEQVYEAMSGLVNQPTRKAVVKLPGRPPVEVTTPEVEDAVARDERVEKFKERAFKETPFARPRDEALAEIYTRREALKRKAGIRPEEPDDFFEG